MSPAADSLRGSTLSFVSSSSQTHVNPHSGSSQSESTTVVKNGYLEPNKDAKSEQASTDCATQQQVFKTEAKCCDPSWEDDPENARNWSKVKKWLMVCIISVYAFIPPLATSMMAPGLPAISEEYHVENPTVVALALSCTLIASAIMPLILAPLSEMYGRKWIFDIGNLLIMVINLGCAFAPSIQVLIAMRIMSGIAGAAPTACGGGFVADLFSVRERAAAMSLHTLGPLLAPVIGPVAGGFLAQMVGVRYIFIVISATSGLAALIGIPLLQETYAPVIRTRREKRLADPEKTHKNSLATRREKARDIRLNLSRPVILLTRSFICFIFSLYKMFLTGTYYLLFSTYADFFRRTYGFKSGAVGLTYLGLGVGLVGATVLCAHWCDKMYNYLSEKYGGVGKPEYRIPALFIGAVMVPLGVLWYGWSAQLKLHWIMPVVGSGIFGFGLMTVSLPITLYLVDSYMYPASALAASAVFRSLGGLVFPLFAPHMYARMGMGPGNTFLAGLTIVVGIPFPIWIYYHGESMRKRCKYTR